MKVLEIICDAGITLETILNRDGFDPIHYAAHIEQDEIVNYLTLRVKYLDTEDRSGLTLLTKYLLKGNLEFATRLLSRSASINHQNKDHKTSLIICIQNG